MKYPKEYLDEIKLRLKVSQVVGKSVQLKKRGKEFIGLSPFKNEKSPSFTVNDEKEFYHCFSSGEHGNIFDFLMKTKSIGFGEAVRSLAAEAGMQPFRFSNFDKKKDLRFQNYKNILKDYSDHFPDIDDPDFKEAWIEGLKQEAKDDRNALARLLKSPRLKYGRVEVKEDEVEDLLRGLTEIRFTIRKTSLKKLSDEELETGLADIPTKNPQVQIGFFAYLLMAEVQERLIQEIS